MQRKVTRVRVQKLSILTPKFRETLTKELLITGFLIKSVALTFSYGVSGDHAIPSRIP